jgi:hypothetical protein
VSAAGVFLAFLGEQRLEGARIGTAREQPIAVDDLEERHWLPAQRRGRRGGLIKVLWHDGQGMCLFAKRLERCRFVWPSTAPRDGADRTVTTTQAQLGYLLEGIDWRLPRRTCPAVTG